MNVKAGDMAIVVVPADWPRKTLDGLVVEVVRFVPPRGPEQCWDQRPAWFCTWKRAWFNDHGVMFLDGALLDSWLRPISGVSLIDEMPHEALNSA